MRYYDLDERVRDKICNRYLREEEDYGPYSGQVDDLINTISRRDFLMLISEALQETLEG